MIASNFSKRTTPAVAQRSHKKTPSAISPAVEARALTSKLQQATASPQTASAESVLALQGTVGNRAVQRLLSSHAIQPKLNVGPANDKYEQEADHVANAVLQASPSAPAIQRRASFKDGAPIRTKPLTASITPLVQRQADVEAEEEDTVDEAEGIQTKRTASANGFEPGNNWEQRLQTEHGGGQPLPTQAQSSMEAGFGADFSGVRIHTDATAVQLNRDIQAQAFTHGSDIYFGTGKFNPGTPGGQHLLAHELTHVVQQGGDSVRRQPQPATIQRKAGLEGFQQRFETAGLKAGVGLRKTTFQKILDGLAKYAQVGDQAYEPQIDILREINHQINKWDEKHDQTKKRLVRSKPIKDKRVVLQELKTKVQQLKHDAMEAMITRGDATVNGAAYPKTKSLVNNISSKEFRNEDSRRQIEVTRELVYLQIAKQKVEQLEYYKPNGWEAKLAAAKEQVALRTSRLWGEGIHLHQDTEVVSLESYEKGIYCDESEIGKLDDYTPYNIKTKLVLKQNLPDTKVKYLSNKTKREDYRLQLGGGLIKRVNEKKKLKPYDTANETTWFSGMGKAIYVMAPNGALYAGSHKLGQFHHSSFLAGGAVAGAGEMEVTNGQLKWISNKSGHYKPDRVQMLQVLKHLYSSGVPLNGVKLDLHDASGATKHPDASQVLQQAIQAHEV